MDVFSGVISAGVSVPVQISTQNVSDLAGSNYWPRLQWSSIFSLPTELLSKAAAAAAVAVAHVVEEQQHQGQYSIASQKPSMHMDNPPMIIPQRATPSTIYFNLTEKSISNNVTPPTTQSVSSVMSPPSSSSIMYATAGPICQSQILQSTHSYSSSVHCHLL